jgi:predicted amidohydrolase YtcJ
MNEPFADRPDTAGFLTMPEEDMRDLMRAAHAAGLQICTHAIGDRATRLVADLYLELLRENPRPDCRHRIEHASSLDAATVADMAAAGIYAAVQPMFIHSEKGWLHSRLGSARTPWCYPFRTMLDAGVAVSGASDAPLESLNVMHAVQCCVTREGFHTEQGVSPAQAVSMFTGTAARAQFMERERGRIAPGLRADFAILSERPDAVPPDQIKDIAILRTIIGGRTVFEA